MTPRDCFISYTRRGIDLDTAIALEEAVSSQGLTCWRDVHEIEGGDKFFNEIVDALESAKCVVAVISEQSLTRDWVIGEIFTACAFEKIIPVRLGGIAPDELPFGIGQIYQCLDANDHQRIVAAVRAQGAKDNSGQFLRRAPKPKTHATLHVVEAIAQWPSSAKERLRWQRDFRAASHAIAAHRSESVRAAYERFCNPTEIVQGLHDLRRAIASAPQSVDWMALAHLARPFDPNLALAAIENAELPPMQAREWLGNKSVAELQSERITPRPSRAKLRKADLSLALLDLPTMPSPSSSSEGKRSETEALPVVEATTLSRYAVVGASALILVVAAFTYLNNQPVEQGAIATKAETAVSPSVEEIPSYCGADRMCAFPDGHSFARVAIDCFGDERLWPLIWATNSDRFERRDPDRVYSGERFMLPEEPACRPSGLP